MWGTIASAAIPAVASLFGQQQANDTNVAIANAANAASAAEAQKNRDFQAEMSNTSHQREVADLKAAGLNPLLSGTGGAGASTPAGAQGDVTAAKVDSALASSVTSAMSGFRLSQEAEMQGAQLDNMAAERGLKKAQTLDALASARAQGAKGVVSDATESAWKGANAAVNSLVDMFTSESDKTGVNQKRAIEAQKKLNQKRHEERKKLMKKYGPGPAYDNLSKEVNFMP